MNFPESFLTRRNLFGILLLLFFLSCPFQSYAGDRWTGPTSSLDPLWGAKGSSIMTEALRQPSYQERQRAREQADYIEQLERQNRQLRQNRSRSRSYLDDDDDD